MAVLAAFAFLLSVQTLHAADSEPERLPQKEVACRVVITCSGTRIRGQPAGGKDRFLPDRYLFPSPKGLYVLEKVREVGDGYSGENLVLRSVSMVSRTFGGKKLKLVRLWSSGCRPERVITEYHRRRNPSDDTSGLPPGQSWRLHPVFAGKTLLSYLKEEQLYTGGPHGRYDYEAVTVNLRTLKGMTFRDLFDRRAWPQIRTQVIGQIMAEWDRAAAARDEEVPDRETLHDILESDLDSQSFALAYGRNGVQVLLVFPAYTVHSFALGGVWMVLPVCEWPARLTRHLVPDVRDEVDTDPPDGKHAVYPKLNTTLQGVVADPDNLFGNQLRTFRWLVGSYIASARNGAVLEAVASRFLAADAHRRKK
jgi:hypothetical protein